MRPSLAALIVAAAVACPLAGGAAPATGGPPQAVLVTLAVGPTAVHTMPPALWRKLVLDYLGAGGATTEEGATLADEARCRAAHAVYAVLAVFDRATRLPGLAQDSDRAYAVARFTVRNCLNDTVLPVKTIALESDPLSEADRGDIEPNAERTWERSVRAALARNPLIKPVARIAKVGNGVVFIEPNGGAFQVDQLLQGIADERIPPRPPLKLVVIELGKLVQAMVVSGDPHVGDFVEAAPTPK
ncbi:MAG: hypothetical protein JOZ24_04675 [Candidatus Eremiobacteraeota bacterium]|nr:hypothetical protein [Candidatus Eremiobacteraeota bacterium]